MRQIIDTTAKLSDSRPRSPEPSFEKGHQKRLFGYVALAGCLTLAVIGVGTIVKIGVPAVEDVFSGDDRPTPMSADYIFPPCEGHTPVVMDGVYPKGMVIHAGPHGIEKPITITVGDTGQVTYIENGAERVPNYPGQDPHTSSYVFGHDDNERLDILPMPAGGNDRALAGYTRIIETQHC